jgi:hypothetical protein
MVDPSQMGGGGGAPPGGSGGPGGAPGSAPGAPGGAPDPMALMALAKLARRKRHPGKGKSKGRKKK